MADKDQKTHDPTAKRIEDARRKGDVPHAPELRHAAMFTAMLVVIGGLGIHAFARLATMLARLWGAADDLSIDPQGAQNLMTGLFQQLAIVFAPLFAVLIGFALLGNMANGLPTIAWRRVSPAWSKLSPVAGLKRLMGPGALIEFGKTLLKCALMLIFSAVVLRSHLTALGGLVAADPAEIGNAAGGLIALLVKTIAIPVGALALFDLLHQRRSWLQKMKMSLQEIKDEHKESEGNPKIKAKIRQIGMQRARRRMMQAVPQATVIITNPTHYAVALKYDHGSMGAPVVVAKGVDTIALKIREIATAAGVPIIENRPLARALHASAEIDRPIPIDHYAAVAEVIGYVLRLAGRRRRA